MDDVLGFLLPRPQRAVLSADRCRLPRAFAIRVAHGERLRADVAHFAARVRDLAPAVEIVDGGDRGADVRVALDAAIDPGARAGAYRLTAAPGGVDVLGADAPGVAHALATLEQVLRASRLADERAPFELPGFRIDDWPDFEARGLLIDVSRTKVPTLATLLELADLAAHLKLNQLQLYTEHTFAYRGHETVWRDASPITPADVAALDRRCRERHIELVPNQQSLGHMHRWLAHDRYRALSEVPEGIDHAFSMRREPYGLCATDPRCLAFLEELFDQLLPAFSSRQFNANLDEPADLGLGRSKEACARRGAPRVYLDFLRAVHARVTERGRRMQFWGDVIVNHPELARELPRDAIALDWGYEADHPFAAQTKLFAESGLAFHVCPGTSSWQSVAGRTTNALANVHSAAEHGRAAGASGLLVTDWGDRGHLQPLAASYVGIAAAAACAWNTAGSARDRSAWSAVLDRHVFRDPARALGRAALELGDAYLETGSKSTNGSALFFLLAFAHEPLPHARMPDLTIDGLARARDYLVAARERLACARGSRSATELRWAADVLAFACRFGIARLATPAGAPVGAIPPSERARLADELDSLVAEHRSTWLARNRPGGLDESAGWLERVASALRG
jgi:hypothetical protein